MPGTTDLPLRVSYEHRATQFEMEKGGMPSTDGSKVYFVGLVDNLCEFGQKKYWEHTFKSCIFNSADISSVDPNTYRDRFLKCCDEVFK